MFGCCLEIQAATFSSMCFARSVIKTPSLHAHVTECVTWIHSMLLNQRMWLWNIVGEKTTSVPLFNPGDARGKHWIFLHSGHGCCQSPPWRLSSRRQWDFISSKNPSTGIVCKICCVTEWVQVVNFWSGFLLVQGPVILVNLKLLQQTSKHPFVFLV